jgi:hypothetical protein
MELTEAKRHEIVNLLVGFDENRRKETERASERFLDGVGCGVRIAVRALFGDCAWEQVMLGVYARVDDYGSRGTTDCPHGNDRLDCPNCAAIRLEDAGYTLDGRACEYEPEPPEHDGSSPLGMCLYCNGRCDDSTDVCDRCLDALIASEPPEVCPRCGGPGAHDELCLKCDGEVHDAVVAYEDRRTDSVLTP